MVVTNKQIASSVECYATGIVETCRSSRDTITIESYLTRSRDCRNRAIREYSTNAAVDVIRKNDIAAAINTEEGGRIQFRVRGGDSVTVVTRRPNSSNSTDNSVW